MWRRIVLATLTFFALALPVAGTSCQFLDVVVPTVIPPAVRDEPATQPTAVPPGVDESPRLRNSQEVPPTWTPPVNVRSETPIAPAEVTPIPGGSQTVYTVQPGDTLAEIALQFNVTLEALATANDIQDYDHIEVGQVLVIPGF